MQLCSAATDTVHESAFGQNSATALYHAAYAIIGSAATDTVHESAFGQNSATALYHAAYAIIGINFIMSFSSCLSFMGYERERERVCVYILCVCV